MGVIKKSGIYSSPTESIEEVLENIQNIENQQEEQVPEVRRPKRVKHRAAKPQAIGDMTLAIGKSGKKKKRYENSTYLLSLANSDETLELTIQDFIPQTVSVFTQLIIQMDQIQIWNDFINSTQDDEEWLQKNVTMPAIAKEDDKDSNDPRKNHPAFLARQCFQRIDRDLRLMLKKKHVPMGTLTYLEQELVTFFENRPNSIYQCQVPNSFERLIIHALSQYMDLSSLSYDKSGTRWTKVKNKRTDFCLPPILLSTFLEKRWLDLQTNCSA